MVDSLAIAVAQFAPVTTPTTTSSGCRGSPATQPIAARCSWCSPSTPATSRPTMDGSWLQHAQPLHGPFVRALSRVRRRARHPRRRGDGRTRARRGQARRQHAGRARRPPATWWPPTASCTSTTRSGSARATGSCPGEIEPPQTFASAGFTVGLQTCYDIRFPEVTRRLVDAGADLVLRARASGCAARSRSTTGAPC